MSFLATAWAEEAAPTADIYERMILMCMAARADHDGCGVYRSIPRLARSCHCDDETVKRRLKAMLKRGLIGLGDQSRAAHIDKRYRPKVYDLLIPYEWFSEQQLALVDQERAENGLRPLRTSDRPAIAPAPARRTRSDHGVPNPKRSAKSKSASEFQGALTEPPGSPVDNSGEGSHRAVSGGSVSRAQGALTEPQIRPYEPVPKESVRPDTREAPSAHDVPADGRTDNLEGSDTPGSFQPGSDAFPSSGSEAPQLLDDPAIQHDLRRIDLLPATKSHQHTQLARLGAELERSLLRFPAEKVAIYLASKAREAKTVTWLIRAFTEYGDAIKDVPMPSSPVSVDQAFQAITQSLPPIDDDRKQDKAAPVAPEASMPKPAESLASPVTWLTDAQFEALSPQDRAHVRAAGETSIDELLPVTAKRITAIQRATQGAAA